VDGPLKEARETVKAAICAALAGAGSLDDDFDSAELGGIA
jgi:hypothetical protein